MKTKRTHVSVAALMAVTTLSSQAVLTSVSTSVPVATGGEAFFSDGGSDYFGVVDNTGTMIAGAGFSGSQTIPPAGSLAGRDHDDSFTRPALRTAEWQLNIGDVVGANSPFTNIAFNGQIAARDVATNGTGAWDNAPASSNVDRVTFELFIDGSLTATDTKDFRADVAAGGTNGNLALDTNNDGVGDGAIVVPTVGQAFSLSGVSANSTIVLRVTAHSDSGNEEYWTSGTLSADVDVVPEPSSSLMLALAGCSLLIRRKK